MPTKQECVGVSFATRAALTRTIHRAVILYWLSFPILLLAEPFRATSSKMTRQRSGVEHETRDLGECVNKSTMSVTAGIAPSDERLGRRRQAVANLYVYNTHTRTNYTSFSQCKDPDITFACAAQTKPTHLLGPGRAQCNISI